MIELKLIDSFPQEIIAVDEVGRGPLCGPVVVGAVRLMVGSKEELKGTLKFLKSTGINDSKKLSSNQRLKILSHIGIHLIDYRKKDFFEGGGIKINYVTWEMDHQVIDEENILAASLRGMKEAALFLSSSKKNPTTVLIDGNKKFRWDKTSPFNEIPIVGGDQKSLLIGLASIVAKEKRDEQMRYYDEIYPEYGMSKHFGYPTKLHKEAIKKFGPSPIHRKTFKGVKEVIVQRAQSGN